MNFVTAGEIRSLCLVALETREPGAHHTADGGVLPAPDLSGLCGSPHVDGALFGRYTPQSLFLVRWALSPDRQNTDKIAF